MAEPQTDRERQELAMLLRDIRQRKRQQLGGTIGRMGSHMLATLGGDHARSYDRWYPDREKKVLSEEGRKLAALRELHDLRTTQAKGDQTRGQTQQEGLEARLKTRWDQEMELLKNWTALVVPQAQNRINQMGQIKKAEYEEVLGNISNRLHAKDEARYDKRVQALFPEGFQGLRNKKQNDEAFYNHIVTNINAFKGDQPGFAQQYVREVEDYLKGMGETVNLRGVAQDRVDSGLEEGRVFLAALDRIEADEQELLRRSSELTRDFQESAQKALYQQGVSWASFEKVRNAYFPQPDKVDVPSTATPDQELVALADGIPSDDGGSLLEKALREIAEGEDPPETVREFMRRPEFRQYVMESHKLTDPSQIRTKDLKRGLRQLMYWDRKDPHREEGRAYFRGDDHPSPEPPQEPREPVPVEPALAPEDSRPLDELGWLQEDSPLLGKGLVLQDKRESVDILNKYGDVLWSHDTTLKDLADPQFDFSEFEESFSEFEEKTGESMRSPSAPRMEQRQSSTPKITPAASSPRGTPADTSAPAATPDPTTDASAKQGEVDVEKKGTTKAAPSPSAIAVQPPSVSNLTQRAKQRARQKVTDILRMGKKAAGKKAAQADKQGTPAAGVEWGTGR